MESPCTKIQKLASYGHRRVIVGQMKPRHDSLIAARNKYACRWPNETKACFIDCSAQQVCMSKIFTTTFEGIHLYGNVV